ncbi:class I adenylate-forming enzyme family protein [Phytohabitans houttuyneae]|uniref:AMP-binding protein n=1 Tax=Phytohabitans houttuyneae TaxID=1076126 RepID=A0A6V8KF15_9ACTN|nr:class I adenylate-forming enzyme family protein [Phytohabitans houttuyneae]GFJ82404.1 AMP-binding protein [Phytohabitans houttuyneae]
MPTTTQSRRRIGPLAEWTAEGGDELLTDSVPRLLARQAEAFGARPALYWPDGDALSRMTYAELASAAESVARALAGRVAPGERVAVWSRNSVEWVVLEYGCALAGLVLTPFNTAWTDAEVAHATALTTPALVFAGTGPTGDSLVPRAAGVCGAGAVLDLAGLREWAATAPAGQLPVVSAEDAFLIQFTSGTTGRSKGAVLTHKAVLNAARERNRRDVIGPNDTWLNPVPYHHIGGSCFVILGGLVDAGAFVVVEKYVPAETMGLLDHGVVTRIGGVPTMIIDALNHLGDHAGAAGLRSVAVGGATMTQHLVERIRTTLGAPVINTYAQSECPAITSTDIHDDSATIAGTVGRPVAGVHMKVIDPATGETVPVGAVGEIVTSSPYVMRGYWGMAEQSAEVLTADGFLRTGDLASMDEYGNVTFQGRVRDVIIRGGENVYPAEVEELLAAHPGIAAAVLVGLDDERLGERVAGVVVRAPGSEVTGPELTEYLRDSVARFKIPELWRFVDALPMTASGKIRRFVVRDDTNEFATATRQPGE